MLKTISKDLDELMLYVTQKDCTEIKKLIMENPEAPLLIFAGEEANSGQCGVYESVDAGYVCLKELTIYNEQCLTRDNYEECLRDDMSDDELYENLSDNEFDAEVADFE